MFADTVRLMGQRIVVKTVPVSFGSVIVLSMVGSTTVSVVSTRSSVTPSNIIVPSSITFKVVPDIDVVDI